MRKFSFLVICAVMALFTFSVKAGNSLNMELQPLTPESFYLIDEPGRLTLDDVKRLPQERWTTLGTEPISFGYDTRPYWFRVDIPAADSRRVLQLEYPLLDQVDLYGGEEFAIILPDTDHEEACLVAERFWQAVSSEPFVTEAGLRPVTASFGIASRRHDMEAESELLFAADQALYQAKHNGRNQIVMAANS